MKGMTDLQRGQALMLAPLELQGKLDGAIGKAASNIGGFVNRPGRDFARTRLLSAHATLSAIVCMGCDALRFGLAKGSLPPECPRRRPSASGGPS